jgi:hypothetical protein
MKPEQLIGGLVYIWLAISAVGSVRKIVAGYRRRRPHWSRDSWLRFLAVAGTGLALLLVPLAVEIGIGMGWYSRAGLTSNQMGLFVVGALAFLLLGAFILAWSIGRLVADPPEAPFPKWGGQAAARPTISD